MIEIFQQTMEKLLLNMEILLFLDNTAIALQIKEEHVAKVDKVLQRLTYDAEL
jgi:hypothetical protein